MEMERRRETIFKTKTDELVLALSDATPVDTGLAASSWKADKGTDKAVISNDVPYIEQLNEGHSQQAPARFIEREALKYGKPIGVIVRVSS